MVKSSLFRIPPSNAWVVDRNPHTGAPNWYLCLRSWCEVLFLVPALVYVFPCPTAASIVAIYCRGFWGTGITGDPFSLFWPGLSLIPRPIQKITGLHWNEATIFFVCLATSLREPLIWWQSLGCCNIGYREGAKVIKVGRATETNDRPLLHVAPGIEVMVNV